MKALESEIIGNFSTCDTTTATPKQSELSQLFKLFTDPWEAEAERDLNFGYTPRNIIKSASFTK
ncbi:hypothetical protein [Clostridium estertheticum]|uniref:hypothetical protein n=1 Tax=Clostridium estertheticum TaxID=238834 RepID=UPI001C7D1642|nr:hypothetical protein [Clostridium estertheticum]MBX4264477.1 hypothetical protein [Clostridium estertheticum]WLC89315.1 hypothetical protein KTC95_03570 [Clostridium estertheticum]